MAQSRQASASTVTAAKDVSLTLRGAFPSVQTRASAAPDSNVMTLPSTKPTVSAGVRGVLRYSEAPIPTAAGEVRVVVFREVLDGVPDENSEHVAIIVGEPGSSNVLTRAHSECMTSEVFGSLKCDCRDQLDAAIAQMHAEGAGVFLYLRQEIGRAHV
mgnify:CR=1 FL=1